jgi:iron(III) transport system permease protein
VLPASVAAYTSPMAPFSPRPRGLIWLLVTVALAISAPVLAADERARLLVTNTILLSAAVAAASMLLGAPLAFVLVRTDAPCRKAVGLALAAMLFVPLYLQAAAWQAGFGLQGWFTALSGAPLLLDGWRGAIAIHTLAAIPWVVLIVSAGLALVEPELEENALLDASPGGVFRRVTLARAAVALAAALLWVAVTTAGEMTVTDLFQIRTYAEQLYTEFALGDAFGVAPWKLLPSILAAGWIVVAALVLTSRLTPPDRHVSERRGLVFRLGRWRAPTGLAALGAVGLLVGIPVGSLVVKAGMIVTRHEQGLVRNWSAGRCAAMTFGSPARFSREFGWSLVIAALAATAAVAVGLVLAWNARRGGPRAGPAWLAVALGLALPGPLVGLGLIAVFNNPDWPWLIALYDHSIAVIWIAQSVRALPLCTLVLWYALRTIPVDVLDSATLEGAGPATRLLRIALPQRWPAVAAAWLVALAIAWGELSASILVVPPGVTTLPIQIFGLIHYGVDDRVAGIALVVMAAFFTLSATILAIVRRARNRQ